MLDAVIFDLDGVIVKFNLDSKKIKEEVIEHFVRNGLPKGVISPVEPFSKIKEKVRTTLRDVGMDQSSIERVIKIGEDIPIKYEIQAAYQAQLLPGVQEVLLKLKARGLKLAIFTYNNSKATAITLNENGLGEIFNVVVARDMVPNPKPNPLHLEVVLKRLGSSKEKVIVVGDSEMDIKPSQELGIPIVAITSGVRSADELEAFKPDYIIREMTDLLEIVDKMH